MDFALGQSVLKIKANVSHDCGLSVGDNPVMAKGPAGTAYKTAFIARVKEARESLGVPQQHVADRLEITQDKYSKYEFRSFMPHALIEQFCLICGISEQWLLTGKGRGPKTAKRPAA